MAAEEQAAEGQEAGEEEGEEAGRRCWMGEEVGGEAPWELRHALVEGEEGGCLCWAGEAVEQTCPVGMEGEEGVRRWVLWRGEAVAGHLAPGQEEGEEGLSCGAVVGEEGRL